MKLNKRANIYKASNVTFNAETHEAVSYDWWTFVKRINGQLVFNNHSYSNSTIKHQNKVRSLLRDLGLEIDLVVNARCGLQSSDWTKQALESIESNINEVSSKLQAPRRKKALDQERLERLNELNKEKQVLEAFILNNNLG